MLDTPVNLARLMPAPTVPGAYIASVGPVSLLQKQQCRLSTRLLHAGNSTSSTTGNHITKAVTRSLWPNSVQDVVSSLRKVG